jgi:formylglycine-generating enzyme required for sulfatase activity
MRSGNVIDFEMLKADKLEHMREKKNNSPISAVHETSLAEENDGEEVIVRPEEFANEKAVKKRKLSIRSKVQSIRDDLYADGERVTSIEFCYIPAGTFRMGRFGNFHRVTINKSFYLGKYPITQEQWEAVMGDNPSDFKEEGYPVEQVSWDDCQEFIERLNQQTGQTKYRLPTEAEWEYACRAGSATAYSFGDEKKRLNEYSWYYGNSGGRSHPVGQKLSNPWGLHDMHGGVWEWCKDWYAPYPRWKAIDPEGPSSGSDRVLRGGSWFDGPRRCRSAFRSYFSPDFRCNFFGFRLARKA